MMKCGANLQRRKILTIIGVFFATLPISYVISAFIPWGSPIAHALISLGVYWVTAAEIAYISSTILTSLFFTYIAWHLMKPIKNQKNLIPIVVFFVTLPVSLIISFYNPLARLLFDILRTRIDAGLATLVLALSFTVVPSLFLAFLARFLVKSKKNSKVLIEGGK